MCWKITWKAPAGHTDKDQVLATLKKNPGRWAFLKTYKGPWGAGAMKSQMKRKYPDYEWEAISKGKTSDLYARYKED
jgi:hypothetical protein